MAAPCATSLLADLKRQGKRICGYAATAKSATLLNYCAVTPEQLDFIADSTPVKDGKLTPGSHIPIRSPAYFAANTPDFVLLLAWNHRQEIEAKEQNFRNAGGKWIMYWPRVEIL